ncbi:Heparinase II/III-like protein [Pseudarcicella hirudinis]|uniref:Heparinase II/III-like protein n=1 Tax=Pseudarcicella hirudinis TaxID=1079859 RepID=A0A1I5NNB9_9BACT|nr:heparinase II/III family protein [Pseudarcicella hirudinis]SFP23328.1 Heparinase II/III-like protein [Pseudarcicella hirudinis]
MKQIILKLKAVFLVSLILIGSDTFGQLKQRNILSRFSQEEISRNLIPAKDWTPFPKTAEIWQKNLPDSVQKQIISNAEKLLGKEFQPVSASLWLEYVRTGDRNNFQKVSFSRRNQLMSLVLAEALERKDRFTEDILNGVWAISEETFWGVPAHLGIQKAGNGLPDAEDPIVDLFAAETASVMALTDYLVGDALEKKSKLIRPRIYYEVNRRIFTPLLTARYGYLGGKDNNMSVNNWNPWIISNWMMANLLLEKNEERRASTLHYSLKLLDVYFNSLGDDGGCDEGPSYWFAAGACMFDALDILSRATNGRISVYDEKLVKNMASYIYKAHIEGDNFINFADAAPHLKPDGILLYRFGKALNDPDMLKFGLWSYQNFTPKPSVEQFFRSRAIFNLFAIKECAEASKASPGLKEPLLNDVWISDIQVMAARAENGLYLASHGGHNAESHNHNDVGDFIVYTDAFPVILDIGSGTYTSKTFSSQRYELWYNTSAYHNLPIVNGFQQKDGRKYEAEHVVYQAGEKESSLKMDIAAAYPKEANLKSWQRIVKLLKSGSVEISDEFESGENLKSLSQIFMTICKINLDTPGKITFTKPDGKQVVLSYDARKWKASSEKMPLNQPDEQKFKQTWNNMDIFRIMLTAKVLKAKDRFVYKIEKL